MSGDAGITWNPSFQRNVAKAEKEGQRILDTLVLQGSSRYVPIRSGVLEKSGPLHTKVGEGEVVWSTPYAKRRYYSPNTGSNGEALRGGYWFARWKNAEGKQAIENAKKAYGGAL